MKEIFLLQSRLHYRLKYGSSVSSKSKPEHVYGDGDGTINIRSLKSCLFWKDKQKQQVVYKPFQGIEHSQMLSDRNVINYIKSVIERQ